MSELSVQKVTGVVDINLQEPVSFSNSLIISANTSADALRITQTGSGNALVVEDSANPDATPFVVDANGRVGIGTSTPGLSAVNGRGYLTIRGSGTTDVTGSGVLQFTSNASYTTSPGLGIVEWNIQDNTGSATTRAAYISSSVFGSTANNVGAFLAFATKPDGVSGSGTERMRITANGDVGIGTSSPTAPLDVNGNLAITGTGRRITGDFSNATVANRLMFQTSTANTFSLIGVLPSGTGNISGFTAFNSSDPTNASLVDVRASSSDVSVRSNIAGTGTYLPMTFYTGGSERVRIDTSGNVGIGTSSPGSAVEISRANAGVYSGLRLTNTTASGTTPGVAIEWAQGGNVKTSIEANTYGGDYLVFKVGGNAERARIDSSGNFLVGTSNFTGGQNALFVSSNGETKIGRTPTNNAMSFWNASASTPVGFIVINSSSTSYITSSDYRLKENIQPMQNALAKVAALKPVTYTWKSTGEDGQGFIAHELQAVVPDCVVGEKDAVDADGNPIYQGVDTSFLVATLTAAIKEQQSIIEDLKARVAQLENA